MLSSFYCIILLAALFLSSCYWQSFPLEARLSAPWADNITTFYEALNASVSQELNLYEFTPPIVRVADRCWCDFASGVFEPYDVQKWERDSIERAVAEMEKQHRERIAVMLDETQHNRTMIDSDGGSPYSREPSHDTATAKESFSILRSLFSRRGSNDPLPTPTSPSLDSTGTPTQPESSASTSPQTESPSDILLLPAQLDLRPYGFDVIVDFRWSRRS